MTTWSGRRRTIRVLAVLASLGVLLAVVGVVLPVFGDDGDTGEREKVTSRASDFAVAMNTFDFDDTTDYRTSMKSLLTPDYYKQFVERIDATAKVLKNNKINLKSGDAKIVGVAVETLDADSAEAIVAVDASIESNRSAVKAPREFRWKVAFTKSGGEWLVSRYESVGTVESQVTTNPTATPGAPAADGGDDQ